PRDGRATFCSTATAGSRTQTSTPRTAPRSSRCRITRSSPIRTHPATRIQPIRRGSATSASTTLASSGKTAERRKSADERLAAHAEYGVAAEQHVKVYGIAVMGGGIREAADIARGD